MNETHDTRNKTSAEASRRRLLGSAAALVVLLTAGTIAVAQVPARNRAAGVNTSDCVDGSCCQSGYAIDVSLGLTDPDEPGPPSMICTTTCEVDADCSSGQGCRFVTEGAGTKRGLCFPRA